MKRSPKAEDRFFLPAACHGAALTFGVVLPKVALRKGYAVMTQADEDGVVTWRENRELAALPRPWRVQHPGGCRSCLHQVPTPARVRSLLHPFSPSPRSSVESVTTSAPSLEGCAAQEPRSSAPGSTAPQPCQSPSSFVP